MVLRDLVGPPSLLLLGALALTLAPTPAHACGGMVFPNHEERAGGMSDQELFVAFTATETVLVASADYEGVAAADFAFVLPLGSNPTDVRDGDPALFIALDELTAPRISIFLDEGDSPSLGCAKSGDAPSFDGGGGDVMVHQRGQTATYAYVVLGGDTGSAVADWLVAEGYPLPADYAAALDPYVTAGRFFFAAKVLPEAASGALRPIELHLPASPPEALEIPLGIAAYSLPPGESLGLTTYFWSDGAVLPDDYTAAAIDTTQLVALSDAESNYAELERAVLDGNPQGAWVIDSSRGTRVDELQDAYGIGLDYGRVDPNASDFGYVTDLFARMGVSDGHLTRIRTELGPEQLRDMTLRRSGDTVAYNDHEVTFSDDPGGCTVDHGRRYGGLVLLVPMLALLRPRRRRRAARASR